MSIDRHLIIGAGFVGLGMAKAMRDAGLPYDQVEADAAIGGNWYHGVYPHVHIISSKKTTEFTDYPMPDDYPDFPSATQVLTYLRSYAAHFQLTPRVELNKTVAKVMPHSGDKWRVVFADGEERIYKGVLVCNGHHWLPRWPDLPGTFAGEYIHSKDYKREDQLAGKRVLVIGGGNSATDIAVDGGRVAKTSHVSLKYGYWFLPNSIAGKPLVEHTANVPLFVRRWRLKQVLRKVIGRYSDYGLPEPTHKLFDRHPTVNSLFLYYLKQGLIHPRAHISAVSGNDVTFTDGKRETYDMIVAATGYHVSFPFLPKGLFSVSDAIPQIPAGTFHADYRGLYIVGWGQVRYGVGPLITAGGPVICHAIKVQDRLKSPIGAVLAAIGVGAPRSHLIDPIEALRGMKYGKIGLGLLPLVERFIKFRIQTQKPLPASETWEFAESSRYF